MFWLTPYLNPSWWGFFHYIISGQCYGLHPIVPYRDPNIPCDLGWCFEGTIFCSVTWVPSAIRGSDMPPPPLRRIMLATQATYSSSYLGQEFWHIKWPRVIVYRLPYVISLQTKRHCMQKVACLRENFWKLVVFYVKTGNQSSQFLLQHGFQIYFEIVVDVPKLHFNSTIFKDIATNWNNESIIKRSSCRASFSGCKTTMKGSVVSPTSPGIWAQRFKIWGYINQRKNQNARHLDWGDTKLRGY